MNHTSHSHFSVRERGLALIEGVVAVAIIGTALVSMVGVFHLFLRTALRTTPELKAVFLVEEGLEATRAIRDRDWTTEIASLALDAPYYLVFSGGQWEATTTATYVDGVYERLVRFASVNRDSDGRIVETGGTADSGTRQVTVTVSWSEGGATTTKSAQAYIMDQFSE